VFLKQQLRWKRSWLRESIRAAGFMWKKEPAMCLSFYMGLFIPVVAPIIVVFALVIAPLTSGFFPAVYIVGLACMSAFMSAAYLLVKKSRLWIYGFYFCLFYLVVLMWQMPWAVATFSSSDWGTRSTSLEGKGGQNSLPSPRDIIPEEIPVRVAPLSPSLVRESA
jgi:hyaluronan synthase